MTLRSTTRRALLLQGATATLLPLAGGSAFAQAAAATAATRRFEPQVDGWRTFEVTTTVSVPEAQGTTRLWLPVPSLDNDWQRSIDNAWSGNAANARLESDAAHGVRMLVAEFPASVKQPTLTMVNRVQTRNRAVDWSRTQKVAADPAELRAALQPAELMPLDGIVRQTALDATRGASTDIDKVRALYRWVVSNAHREPKVRGCGTGDIKTMLETGNLGGKCADLNAIFVGLCRSVGVPARDVYGLRLVPSAFGYRELSGNPSNLKGAQHCRAEVFLKAHGWVAMDPADVLKVMRQETPEWIKDTAHPLVAPVAKGLFGSWEGNWLGYNDAHDVRLPGAKGTLPFLMYPQGENAQGRFDELAPDSFRYTISAQELKA